MATKGPSSTAIKTKSLAKTKKVSTADKKKTKSPSTHPTYEQMIKDAIATLKERTGSSKYAIQKFNEEKHKQLPPTFRKLLLVSLKRLVAAEKLVKVKASFKLPSEKPSISKPPAPLKGKPAKPLPKPKSKSVGKGSKEAELAKSKKSKSNVAKPKSVAAAKPKSTAAKLKSKQNLGKAARTSIRISPGKKAVVPKKVPAAKKPKTVESPAKRASSRRAKK